MKKKSIIIFAVVIILVVILLIQKNSKKDTANQSQTSSENTVNIGGLFGITGPISSMAADFIPAAEFAVAQINQQGGLFGNNTKLNLKIEDSACNPQGAIDAANKSVNLGKVVGILGPNCSGALISAANAVTIPTGVPVISPTATSPTISDLDDKGLVFRTVVADDEQGKFIANTLFEKGIYKVAISYINNDYGKGLNDSFITEFRKLGAEVVASEGHEGGRVSYRTELAELSAKGADTLLVFDYANDSGLTVVTQALENKFFTTIIGSDSMKSNDLIANIGGDNLQNFYLTAPKGQETNSLAKFNTDFTEYGGNKDGVFVTNTYDSAFILALAIEKAGSTDKAAITQAITEISQADTDDSVVILPGEWSKAKKAIADGLDINYEGAAGTQDFDAVGNTPGSFGFYKIENDLFVEE